MLDNDIIIKCCSFNCAAELVASTTIGDKRSAALGVARFVASRRLKDTESRQQLGLLLDRINLVEPAVEEIELAADLEQQAVTFGVNLDVGESLLTAIILLRASPLLVTGDKRAVFAISRLEISGMRGRCCCLEQLFATMISIYDLSSIRPRVCHHPGVDKAITNCFSCSSNNPSIETVLKALKSYTDSLRKEAPDVLFPANNILPVIA